MKITKIIQISGIIGCLITLFSIPGDRKYFIVAMLVAMLIAHFWEYLMGVLSQAETKVKEEIPSIATDAENIEKKL